MQTADSAFFLNAGKTRRQANYFTCRYIRYRYIVTRIEKHEMPKALKPDEVSPESLLPLSAAVFSILLSLSGEEKHGYAIMKEVAEADGGSLTMGPGTLYGSLDRMIRARLVEESGLSDDERRRYYRITRFGRKVLGAELVRLNRTLKTARSKGILPSGETA